MSGPERPPEPAVPTSKLKRQNLSVEDQEELDKLDGIFRRIKSAVPAAPYVLSTPSLHPYAHYSRHESQSWMMGRLFQPDEEHLQYRTFHYREPYQDCFTLQPGEEDEPEVERPKSQASNTPHQGPKKKISLSAYKSKQANGVITPGAKKVSPALPPTKPAPVQTNGVKEAEKQLSSARKVEESKSHKRPATESLVPGKPEKRIKEDRPSAPPPSQKTKSADSKMNLDPSGPSNATPHGLPPLLSPVDQPLNNPYGLPAILSPTLPSNIQVELDRLESQRKRAESNVSTSSSDRKSQLLAVSDSRSHKQDDGTKSNSRMRSVSLNGKSPSSVSLSRNDTLGPSLLVKLKVSKRIAATVSQLLRLPPKRSAAATNEKRERQENAKENAKERQENVKERQENAKERQENAKERPAKAQAKSADGIASKSKDSKITTRRPDASTPNVKATAIGTKVAEKRPRNEDDTALAMPSKRQKAQPVQDGPRTPSQQFASSPDVSNKSSAQKSQGPYMTPRKDHKAISMLRTNSTEGYDSTPGRSGATPAGSKHVDPRAAPTSASLNSKKQADVQSLSQISMKLNQMGRSLKHEAQKVVVEKGSRVSKEDLKRAAVICLECILSYMAAYHAQDLSLQLRGRPAEVENTWKTLLPLCMSYTGRTKDFPHLDGLRSYLSATISAAICAHVAPRAVRPKAHDSPHDTPHPELAKQHSLMVENFMLLSDHFTKLHRFTQEARTALPIDDIQKWYPKTWAGRETNARLAKEPEKVNGVNLSGPYFLPIQNDTAPIQAVRFGLKFLGEYCERERLNYRLHVNLEKSE